MLRQTFQRLIVQARKLCRDIEIECCDIMQGKRHNLCRKKYELELTQLCHDISFICRDKLDKRQQ